MDTVTTLYSVNLFHCASWQYLKQTTEYSYVLYQVLITIMQPQLSTTEDFSTATVVAFNDGCVSVCVNVA